LLIFIAEVQLILIKGYSNEDSCQTKKM
jgi:hypothetical protein